jgi:hypothetical protein
MRYDKLDAHYLAFVQLAAAMVWLHSLGGTIARRPSCRERG